MKRLSTLLVALVLLVHTGARAAEVRDWEYVGLQNPGTVAEGIVARTSVDDDTLELIYFTNDNTFALWFTYRGDVTFSQANAQRAEVFMRTRDEGSLTGRVESDYVFRGKTVAQPDSDPGSEQFVVTLLTEDDVSALYHYEKNGIIGVGYFIEGELWRTYSLTSKGVWAAFERVYEEAQKLSK